MFGILFPLFLLTIPLFASDPFLPDSPPEKSFSLGHELIGDLVHPRTGQFSISRRDLVANGVEPLSLTRYYYPPSIEQRYSKNHQEDRFALIAALTRKFGWIFFPHLVAELHEGKIRITEPDGSTLLFTKKKNGSFKLASLGPFTNSHGQTISSSYDSRNTYCKIEGPHIVIDSKDGSTRYYRQEKESRWLLEKERLPNGRWIVYTYNQNGKIESIESKDPHLRQSYAKLIRSENGWTTHTGLKATYDFTVLSKEGEMFKLWPPGYARCKGSYFFLKHAKSPLIDEHYEHTSRGVFHYCHDKFSSTYKPSPDILQVSDIQFPVGDNEQNTPVHFIKYEPGITKVKHIDKTKTTYRFSLGGFPISREHEGQIIRYKWGDDSRLISIDFKDLYRKEYKSDSLGNPIEETYIDNENSYTIYREYDGLLLQKEEADATTIYTYLPGTNLITSKITDGREEYYVYDDNNNLIETTIEGRTTRYLLRDNYPHIHRIEWIEKEDRKVHLHYDQHGNVSQEDHYDGDGQFLYSLYKTYNERGDVLSETDPLGVLHTYTYDREGRLTSSSKPKMKFTYDKRGRLKTKEDALYKESYQYDLLDHLIEKEDRFGKTFYTYQDGHCIQTTHGDQVTSSTYDPYGRELSRTDGNGHTTYFEYNGRNQPLRIDYPDDTSETYSYYPNGLLKEETNRDGYTTSYRYDSLGRVVSKIYDGVGEESFLYDPYHLLEYTDLEGFTTYYRYDTLGRKIEEERAGRIVSYTYDSLSRVASITKGEITTHYSYDLMDRVIEEATPYSKISYTYDEDGNQSSITHGISRESFEYDALKRLIRKKDPLGNITTIEYQDLSVITTDPRGTVLTENYDIYQNLISKEIKNVTAFRYSYDLAGNLIHQEEDVYRQGAYLKTLITDYTYTRANKLSSIQDEEELTEYLYSPSRKTKIKPDGTHIEYIYNFQGNVISAGSDYFVYNKLGHLIEGRGFKRTLDPFGNILKETFSNGLSIEKTYDELDRPLTMTLPRGTVYYTYDLRLKSLTYKGYTHTYTYNLAGDILQSGPTTYKRDLNGQITKLIAPHLSQDCKYDPLGNLIFATPNSYTYDELSQLGNEFDSHFDLQDAPKKGNLSSINNLELFYDEHDRLIQAGPHHFTYDALGRRLTKNNERYLYNGLEEVGTPTLSKIQSVLLDLNGTLAIPILDSTYTLRYLINPIDHTIINSYEFDPFGTPLAISESIPNPYRYALKHQDSETGLIYFGKRYYNPSTRRWITPDPLGPIDLPNLYTFVKNNPFRYTDHTGLFSVPYKSIEFAEVDRNTYFYKTAMGLAEKKAPFVQSISIGNNYRLDKVAFYIHGINATLERTELCAESISQHADGIRTIGIYNPSNGLGSDVFEYAKRAQSIKTPLSPVGQRLFGALLVEHVLRPPSAKFFVCSFSGGATEVRNVLYSSPQIIRDRVFSAALAPSAIIDKKLCFESHNYVSTSDPIGDFAIINTPWLKDQITYLPVHPKANQLFDHSATSPTYEPARNNSLKAYMEL